MDRKLERLTRFGAICGILFGLSLGAAGAIEAFTGRLAATSFVVALGVAGFGAPALIAFHLRQADVAGRFGAIAAAVDIIGLGLFAGASFAYNVVLFFVETSRVRHRARRAVALGDPRRRRDIHHRNPAVRSLGRWGARSTWDDKLIWAERQLTAGS
ncbi:hypothetical protein [Streptomyces sp. MS1.AVA.4]|uniref:Uncharacterized protein n=1 Tax=Streptomyces pratisoli TaxID=3139917 RepID=A0ACC6QF02_9ACTN